jgi:hypothetical protein
MSQPDGKSRLRLWLIVAIVALLGIVGLAAVLVEPVGEPGVSYASDEDQTLASLEKVDDFPLYTMTYYGDYGFDEFLERGVRQGHRAGVASSVPMPDWACTTFAALNEDGDAILGRNFDWIHRVTLLLFTDPPNGYASVSMVDIEYLGFDEEIAEGADLSDLLYAPYLPFDGMNEHGLTVGIMAVPSADLEDDPSKVTLDSLAIVRLMLDYARTVDEAVELMGNYNIDFGDVDLHYLIADAARHSAVVEFVDGEMVVLRNEEPWHVSTNFIITGTNAGERPHLCDRYETATDVLGEANGLLKMDEAMGLLADVSSSSREYPTEWSIVYNMTGGNIQVVMGRKYDQVHTFFLELSHP